ncbi:hypothetical protein IKT18_02880, partial [Candidatus Saccharibacteria bacterium]|nr:hypothetical protein [Candidatus Saccharibacteria bacterium]
VLGVLNIDKMTKSVDAIADISGNEETLTITTSDIEIDVDLNDTAVFAAGESIVTVDSATTAGYTLMAYVDSTTTDLTNETNKSSTSTITMLDSLEPVSLANNTWGVAITEPTTQASAVFTGLPSTLDEAMTLKTVEGATTGGDKSTFYYGTYITPDLDYGTYSGVTITYIAIANFACNPDATTIQEAVCMQDFAGPNSERLVASMVPNTQYTLIDVRDKKTYTIAKLLSSYNMSVNATVWMTQNLDLDLDSNTTYTNEDTDLGFDYNTGRYTAATWKPIRSTYEATNSQTHEWCSGGYWDSEYNYCRYNYTPESYDAGDLYWNTRLGNESEWNDYFLGCDHSTGAPDCSHVANPLSSYVSSTGDPQYHLGNYYNWAAAVATNDVTSIISLNEGVGFDQESAMAPWSICPAGWRLPSGDWDYREFKYLWAWYGFDNSSINAEQHTLWEDPLYFVPSGLFAGALTDVGYDGMFWTSFFIHDKARSGYFYVDGDIDSYNCLDPTCGHTIRCVTHAYVTEIQ